MCVDVIGDARGRHRARVERSLREVLDHVALERVGDGAQPTLAQDHARDRTDQHADPLLGPQITEPEHRIGARPQRKGDTIAVDTDEGVRPGTTPESLGKLRPAFDADGTITAGNASQISDGGAAVIVMSKEEASRRGATPLGEVVAYGQVAGPDPSLLTQPSRATTQALDKAGLSVSDVDLFEFNEAFAAVGLASMDELGISDDIVNVNGGAIALGHPIGMSGTRLALTILHELRRRGGGLGAAALCGGGGQGDAILLRTL